MEFTSKLVGDHSRFLGICARLFNKFRPFKPSARVRLSPSEYEIIELQREKHAIR